ncbi:MAG TPA: hypothetical protein VF287_08490 [Usitatibacter sp.]
MSTDPSIIRRLARLALAGVAAAGLACGQAPESGPAATLRAKYAELHDKLERNAFGRELHLSSREEPGQLTGEVYGVLEFPFAQVESGLREARSWCDVLILPFNTKHCYAAPGEAARTLAMRIGRKAEQPAELAYPLEFNYRIAARAPDYFRIVLSADKGPIGTRDYQIAFEATPLDAQRTFIHFGYAYGFGAMSRLALQVYLGTVGASKVGFTVTARDEQNRPTYVGGLLGATERNTMRYFLAIEAYLASLSAPAAARVDQRLSAWFEATERYPTQLHEMDRGEYLSMKQKETQRSSAAL